MMADYRVQLDSYSGPLDLLLYLIRRDEVDIYDIPISRVLGQYLEYVHLLEQLDPDTAGDFLVLAATLMEIKSRLLLPRPPPEVEDGEGLDPRADLVRQLLAYKVFRDAAGDLSRRAEVQAQRHPRGPTELTNGEPHVDIEDVQVWDLLTAFNKLLAAVGRQPASHEVVYDDTPIMLHAADILDRLVRDGPSLRFEQIFEGRTRGEMIGLFLALLELIRQDRIRVEQSQPFGTIAVHLLDATPITAVLASAEERGFREELEGPAEGEGEPAEPGGMPEPVFEDEDEPDEFSRRISAVRIDEVDLGRSAGDAGRGARGEGPGAGDAGRGAGDGLNGES